jgi:hypothetical protein
MGESSTWCEESRRSSGYVSCDKTARGTARDHTDGGGLVVVLGAGYRIATRFAVDQAFTLTAEPDAWPVFRRKLVRSCRAELVSPEFSALFS